MTERSLLDGISIASPCTADWNRMQGDARRRFCSSCGLHVHDLGGMTRAEALALLQGAGAGRLCVRLFRRADGTMLLRDCPVGLRQRLRRAWARAAALVGSLWAAACARPPAATPAPEPPAAAKMGEVWTGAVAREPGSQPGHEMGDVRAPGPQPPPSK